MTTNLDQLVEERLRSVLAEMRSQTHLAEKHWDDRASFDDEMEQIREYIEDAGEYSVGYEVIVANLEQVPFQLSGSTVVGLLEVGLLMGYKTEDDKDEMFDRRG